MDSRLNDLAHALRGGEALSATAVRAAVEGLLSEGGSLEAKAGFLRAFAAKGESAEEIAAFVDALLERAVAPEIDPAALPGPVLDVCGTGGDRLNLFNVSTTSMFLLAAAGVVVLKHGNRSITSRCGGADVLEALGVPIDLSPDALRAQVERAGVGFIFAPRYHPAFRVVAPVRKMLAANGETSVFNLLGPLLNPARPAHQLVGIFSGAVQEKYAAVLEKLGRKHAWVVHGRSDNGSGMDELSTMGPTRILTVRQGRAMHETTLEPEALGLTRATLEQLQGDGVSENARILTAILSGEERGPRRDLVVLNAAAGLVIAGAAADLTEGLALAREQLDSGRALGKLRLLAG